MISLRGAADIEAPTCSSPIAHYTTDTGERLFATLPDGSQIAINTESEVIASCSRSGRLVRLIKGEALLRVKHERAPRPLLVWSRNSVVQDVGTGFNVRMKEGSIDVAVTEGTVRVYPHVNTLWQPSNDAPLAVDSSSLALSPGVELHKGAHVTIFDNGSMSLLPALTDDGLSKLTAWVNGQIWLDDITVAEAVAEFNRYSNHKFKIVLSPQLAQNHVTGYFDDSNMEDLIVAVEKEFNIRLHRSVDAQGITLLTMEGGTGNKTASRSR